MIYSYIWIEKNHIMKRIVILIAAVLASYSVSAVVPHRIVIPDVPGYKTLKGDFHVHTRFSDCDTWPSERVSEAAYDCLDFLSITDHLDSRHQHMVNDFGANVNENTSYEIASKAGKSRGVLVIHGAEITRGTCIMPAHFNVHFIEDAVPIVKATEARDNEAWKDEYKKEEQALTEGLKVARKQGGFLVWNHPDWERQAHNETIWWPMHTRLLNAGLMDGIEIVNRFTGYDPEAFHWAVEKNLAVVSGTDCHKPMFELVDYEKGEYRPMTLVFSKEKSLSGIREALDARRTAVLCDRSVYGTESNIKPLFDACIEVYDIKYTAKKVSFKIRNNSSIPVTLAKAPGSENVLYTRLIYINEFEEISVSVAPVDTRLPFDFSEFDVNFSVLNWLTDVDTPMKVSYHFVIPAKYRSSK